MTARRFSLLAGLALCGGVIGGCQQDAGEAARDTARDTTAAVAAGAGAQPTDTGMVDPNTATREQLAAIAGMTPAAADTLVARRPYDDMVAVNRVLTPQLDSAQRRTVYARLWKPIDINKATDAEILLIPGVGSRMLGEFKEYRPYTSVAQFRREIGKYVDADELARLERYVMIR